MRRYTPTTWDSFLDRTVVLGYGRLGFALRRLDRDEVSGATGRTAIVTGATSGIGKATARGLARLGAAVVLAVRNRDRGERVREEIEAELPDAHVRVALCDIADPISVADFPTRYDGPADILVHNAGALPTRRTETSTGHELTLATHVLGPIQLTEALLPTLATSADARVVFVSSGGMYTQRLATEDPDYRSGEYRGATAYARSKRMQVALTPLLAQRWAAQGVAVHAMHPGWVDTPGLAAALPGFHRLAGPLLRGPALGADTAIWLATATPAPPAGQFWHDRHIRPTHYLRRTEFSDDEVARLWHWCRAALELDDD